MKEAMRMKSEQLEILLTQLSIYNPRILVTPTFLNLFWSLQP